jgi:hypothetical protein
MVSASQLYACNSCERDEVLSLSRLVRFELVMTQTFKLRRPQHWGFFSRSAKDVRPDHGRARKSSVTQTAIRGDFRSWHIAEQLHRRFDVR